MLNIKSIKPLYTAIITTANKYIEDSSKDGIITDFRKTEGNLKEYQKVVKVGSSVREVKVGDLVLINPKNYLKRKYDSNSMREDMVDNPIISINIPVVEMNDEDYLLIQEQDVAYVIDDYEETLDTPKVSIITPKPTIIC